MLRPYQVDAIGRVQAAYRDTRRVLLVAPTGFGKTATAAVLIERAVARGRKVVFAVHRREIVLDTHRRLTAAGVRAGLVMAGEPAADAPVQVASVQTLAAREEHPPADLVVWDEAHHVAAESYREIARAYPEAWHLGLTATPERSDGAGLGDAFDRLVVGASVRELTEGGYLAPCDVVAPSRRQDGALAMDPADALTEHAAGRPAVAFSATVRESLALAVRLRERGVRAEHLDGETPAKDRDAILRRFAEGRVDVVSNVFVLTEGWDCPRAEVCLLARGAGSVGTYLQMVGRALRHRPGKRALLLDLVGAVHEHGMPDEDRAWTLDGGAAKRSDADWLAQCPACALVTLGRRCPVTDGRRRCPRCSAPMRGKDPARVLAEKLARVERNAIAPPEVKLAAWERLTAEATEKGYAPGWAAHRFRARFGHWPQGLRGAA